MVIAAPTITRISARRRIYVAVSVLAAAIAFTGFWASYFGPLLLAGSVEVPVFIHFHAAVYVGWLGIFAAQATLAATGRMSAHMKLGTFAIGYGVLMVVAGLTAAFGMFALRVQSGNVAEAQGRLLGPLVDMAVFAPLFAAAIYCRRKPELHKRLIVVATTYLLVAAVGRLTFLGQPRNPYLLHSIWLAPILLAMAHDFWRQRRVHFVYVGGLVLIVATGPVFRVVARASDTWQALSGWLAALVA
jgi:hypothetical protein